MGRRLGRGSEVPRAKPPAREVMGRTAGMVERVAALGARAAEVLAAGAPVVARAVAAAAPEAEAQGRRPRRQAKPRAKPAPAYSRRAPQLPPRHRAKRPATSVQASTHRVWSHPHRPALPHLAKLSPSSLWSTLSRHAHAKTAPGPALQDSGREPGSCPGLHLPRLSSPGRSRTRRRGWSQRSYLAALRLFSLFSCDRQKRVMDGT